MRLEKNRSHEDALRHAYNIWTGTDYRRGECEDAHYQLCFGKFDPFDYEFQSIAVEVFEPLLENLPYALLFDLGQLADLQEVRRLLEVGIIEDAVQTISDGQLARLQAVIDEMRARAQRGQSVFEEDREFHRVLFEHLGNEVLSKLLDVFWATLHKAAILTDVERDADPMHNYRNHAAILEAILDRDVGQARSALHQHYTDFESRLRRAQQKQEISTE